MKKLLLFAVLFLTSAKSFSIIFWQPYPVHATVAGTAMHQRVEFSVYDSLLGNWQYYNTVFFNSNVYISDSVNTVIAYNTFFTSYFNDKDSIYGYVVYDQELHQFRPYQSYFSNIAHNVNNDYSISTEGDGIEMSYGFCCGTWGWLTHAGCFFYNITIHAWTGGYDAQSDGWLGDAWATIGNGGYVTYGGSEDGWDHDGGGYGPFRPFNLGRNGGSRTSIYGHGGDPDIFYVQGDGMWDTDIDVSAADPTPGFTIVSRFTIYNPAFFNGHNGIVFFGDSAALYFGIYDDSLHHWAIDTINFSIANWKIKDRVVAYTDAAMTHIFYEVFSPVSRAWIKDSSLTSSFDSLFISGGTVNWVDNGGASHIAGYNDSTGWGNYVTPLQLNFHISDFYSRTGYPIIFIRDYSIGTDSTWYNFGDGVQTLPGNQHSLYHLFKVNGHYSALPTSYNVCIYANTSAGIQSWCGSRTQPCSFNFDVTSSCTATCNGRAVATPLSGMAPYSYLWSNGDITPVADSLCLGNHTVTITDNAGCSVTYSFTLDTFEVALNATPVSCIGNCDGTINSLISGGTAPYTYSWNNGDTTQAIANLCSGNFILNVTDSNNCLATATVYVSHPAQLVANGFIFSQPSCIDSNGEIDFSPTGGSGNYAISWTPNVGTVDSTFPGVFYVNVPAGSYVFTITDGSGCTVSVNETLVSPPPITSFSVVTTDPLCPGDCNGSFVPVVNGGTPPYEYHICSGGLQLQINLCAGVYCVTVLDDNRCSLTDTFTLVDPPPITAISSSQNPSCGGCTDGFIVLGIINPQNVSWSPHNGFLSGDTIYQLPGGTYVITFTDANGCTASGSDTLLAPTAIKETRSGADFIWVFPNPAVSSFTVQSSNQIPVKEVGVFNLLGKQVSTRQYAINNKEITVDVSELSPGIYFVKVQTENGRDIRKLMIE